MPAPRCPNCAMAVDPESSYFGGVAIKCKGCGYEGLPLKSKSSLYEKVKRSGEDPVQDFFQQNLGLVSIFSKLALASLFAFLISLASLELRAFTMAAFAGFLVFSVLYGFARFKN